MRERAAKDITNAPNPIGAALRNVRLYSEGSAVT